MLEQLNFPDPPIGYFIGRTFRTLKATIHRAFEENGYDVTVEQMGILFILWHEEGISQRELVKMAKKVKSSVTRLIDNMEKRNLVLRVADQNDKRNKLIYLTHKGKSLRAELEVIVDKILKKAQGEISDDEMKIFKKILIQMYLNLTELEGDKFELVH